jgi:hypothetical protein
MDQFTSEVHSATTDKWALQKRQDGVLAFGKPPIRRKNTGLFRPRLEFGGWLNRRGAALNSEAHCGTLGGLIRGTVFLIGTFCLPFLAFQGIVCRFLLGCTRWLGC